MLFTEIFPKAETPAEKGDILTRGKNKPYTTEKSGYMEAANAYIKRLKLTH